MKLLNISLRYGSFHQSQRLLATPGESSSSSPEYVEYAEGSKSSSIFIVSLGDGVASPYIPPPPSCELEASVPC